MKRTATLVFLLCLLIKTEVVLAQNEQVFADSISFVDFLKAQGEIPGLNYRLIDSSGKIISTALAPEVGGIVDYSQALAIQDSVLNRGSVESTLEFLVYNESSSFEASQEYVSNLLRNGDIVVNTPDSVNRKDLISLANKERYSPLLSGPYSYIGDYKIFAVISTITLFFVFAFAMIFFMVLYKARRNRKEKLVASYDEQIVGPLSEILFEKSLEELESLSNEELYLSFPENQLKKPIYMQVLVGRILALNKKMKGDFKLKLKALYKRLDLDKLSIEKLKSTKWDRIVTGMVEVNEMDYTEALVWVKKHVNSPNFHIRSQAVATLLNLSENIDLTFLRDQSFPLSRWQQMNYLRIIKHLHSTRNLHLGNLFDSENQSIRLFGYKLVRVIGRVDLLADLESKFPFTEIEDKIEIIKTFEYLGVPALSELINGSLTSENIKLASIAARAAGVIGDQSTAQLIIKILNDAPGFKLKMTLMKSLQSLNVQLYNQFIEENLSPDLQRISQHLSDPLLQDV
ncbi:hypothetical protein [Algoriphagus chordae]|uniref:hypothetical protein n=1 Tax=Algoriphagus chordae TaxID=237019 RepID=UPI001B860586|nr:hypothetical protein [Algoriphagus chordae]